MINSEDYNNLNNTITKTDNKNLTPFLKKKNDTSINNSSTPYQQMFAMQANIGFGLPDRQRKMLEKKLYMAAVDKRRKDVP